MTCENTYGDRREHWKFILYESPEWELFAEIVYNPVSFADALLLIKLTDEEADLARNKRGEFVKLVDIIQYYFSRFLHRNEDRTQFTFKNAQ